MSTSNGGLRATSLGLALWCLAVFVGAGEVLDIPSDDPHRRVFLKHHRDSLRRIELSDTPPVARKVYGSIRRSRLTPRSNSLSEMCEGWVGGGGVGKRERGGGSGR